MMEYRCYGLSMSSDLLLPELLPADGPFPDGKADVRIVAGALDRIGLPDGRRLGRRLWVKDGALWLAIPGVARFLVRREEIVVDREAEADDETVRAYLMGSAFGAMLSLRGFLVLHGNAVQVGDGCLVCVGESGVGKSTLAAAFAQRGYPMLADDVVAIDAHGRAQPGVPRVKLWQDAAERMRIDTRNLRRIRPCDAKFSVPVLDRFVDHALPVDRICVLERSDSGSVRLEPVPGMERFQLLHRHTYRMRFLRALELTAEHLKQCVQVSSRIRLVRLSRPTTGDTVDACTETILADIARNG